MKKLLSLLVILTCTFSLSSFNCFSQTNNGTQFPDGDTYKNANLTYTIIPAANNTWCYDIYMEGRMFIHQPSIPGLPGNEGFKSKADAKKVAMLVIEKIRKGEMPPSVTSEEMKKLKVL
jgi:hypothetical protein